MPIRLVLFNKEHDFQITEKFQRIKILKFLIFKSLAITPLLLYALCTHSEKVFSHNENFFVNTHNCVLPLAILYDYNARGMKSLYETENEEDCPKGLLSTMQTPGAINYLATFQS